MKGDLSRQTFDAERHYSSVRLQQGRVQLDADFNEQADIGRHRAELDSLDLIGPCGGPLHGAAFAIVLSTAGLSAAEKADLEARFGPGYALVAGDFLVTPGRYYVDGILCENERLAPYTRQPHLPGATALDVTKVGFHIVYLDVWQRHVSALEDSRLRETALGGPDTATRSQTVWQVRTVFAGAGPINCLSQPAAYTQAIAASTGTLAARARPEAAVSSPCIVPESAEYRGLENQLYRVEVHDGGKPVDLSAGGDVAITGQPAPTQIVVASAGWSVGQAVEVFSAAPGAEPMAGTLAHVTAIAGAGKQLTLTVALPAFDLAAEAPRVRSAGATYVWSRDNGSVAALVRTIDERDVVVHNLGPDETLGFQDGDWVELTDTADELNGRPGLLARIEQVLPATNTLRLYAAPGDVALEVPQRGLKIRRWHGAGAAKVQAPAPSSGFAGLEDGVEVAFSAGTYSTGNHWLAPARTASADARSGTIEWPQAGGGPAALVPFGIEHHHCKIGLLQSDGAKLTAFDCRSLFPPITELATLVYVGGDGQEAMPGQPLPQSLEAGVFRGRWPVAGAFVTFTTPDGGAVAKDVASLPAGAQASVSITTGADGIARCAWRLDAATPLKPSQHLNAHLLDAGGGTLPPLLDFSGQLSIAEQVAYIPGGCPDLDDASTVQEALDILCKRPTGGGCPVRVTPEQPIEEAIAKLIDAGAIDIWLCLTVGDHKSGGFKLDKPGVTVRIGGSGPGTRLRVEGELAFLDLEAVGLRDLDVAFTNDAGLVAARCGEVLLETCAFWRLERAPATVRILSARRIRIAACAIDAAVGRGANHPIAPIDDLLAVPNARDFAFKAADFADGLDANARKQLGAAIDQAQNQLGQLTGGERRAYATLRALLSVAATTAPALSDALQGIYDAAGRSVADPALVIDDSGAQTRIIDCKLIGTLALYGPTDDQPRVSQGQLAKISTRMATGGFLLDATDGTLQLRGNRLTRVAVGAQLSTLLAALPDNLARLSVIGSALVSDNVIDRGGNLLLADHLALTATAFTADDGDVGGALTDSSIFTANHAPNDVRLFSVARARAVAGNLTLNIVNV